VSFRLPLLLCLTLGAGVFSWQLDAKHIWIDEAVSWDMAVSPLPSLLEKTYLDVHPPLYYLAIKGWVALFGDSLIALRSLSVVASLLTIVLIFQLGRPLLAPMAVLAVAIAFILSPHTLYLAQEARMYPLVTAAVLLACVAYRSWVSSYFARPGSLIGYIAAMTAALYLHYFAGFVIIGLWLHFAVCRSRLEPSLAAHSLRDWTMAHVAMAFLFLPWLQAFLGQVDRGQPWRQVVAVGDLPFQLREFALGIVFGFGKRPEPASFAAIVVLVLLGGALAGLIAGAVTRRARDGDIFLASITLVPIVIGLALLPVVGFLMLTKYLAYTAPLFLLAAARGMATLKIPDALVGLVMLTIACVALPELATYYAKDNRDYDAQPIAEMVQDIAHHAPDGTQDQFLVVPDYFAILLRYYTRDSVIYQPVKTADDLRDALKMAAGTTNRVWVVADYRWELLNGPMADDRLLEVPVSTTDPRWVKLYRMR
jgi:mannosyltransferase